MTDPASESELEYFRRHAMDDYVASAINNFSIANESSMGEYASAQTSGPYINRRWAEIAVAVNPGGYHFFLESSLLETTRALLGQGLRISQLIACSCTEAEAIQHMVLNHDPDLRHMRLSARKAADVFYSFRHHSLLRGSLGSANCDFGHNTFHRGSNCANGIDPKETLRELLMSGALAAISTVFMLCPDKKGGRNPDALEIELRQTIDEVATESGVVLYVLCKDRSACSTLFALLHLRSSPDEALDPMQVYHLLCHLHGNESCNDDLSAVELIATAATRGIAAKRPAIEPRLPLSKESSVATIAFFREPIIHYLQDSRRWVFHLEASCQEGSQQPRMLRVSDPHLLRELQGELTMGQMSRICTCEPSQQEMPCDLMLTSRLGQLNPSAAP